MHWLTKVMEALRPMKRQKQIAAGGLLFFGLAIFGQAGIEDKGRYLDAALRAEKWIAGTVVSGPDGLAWPAEPQDPKSINSTLYAGNPGVVLFYLELYASTGDKAFLKKACAGADFVAAGLPQEKTMGLYEGLAGVGFALEETYKASREEKYRQSFLKCLDLIRQSARPAGQGVEWDGTTDIISGSAGTGLFLLYASSELADKSLLDLASKAGDRLVELGKQEGGGLKWAMDATFPRLMPNFSHGTAGIAYFLATLYEKTDRKAHLEAALAGAGYLLSIAKTDGDSCLVFHDEPDGKDLYYLGWCHGPVGTARLFHRLFRITKDDSWLGWVKRSANGLMESGIPEKQTPGFWNNAGICCGLAGVGDFFLSLYETTRDKKYLDFARRITDKLLAAASADGEGLKWIQAEHRTRPELLIAQTGLMQGAAGIGLFLLHYDALEHGRRIKVVLPDTPF
jgi:lantibiotic modifying enzyme